jgi:monovalent cation:H+ antiporter-2, CPA2 family
LETFFIQATIYLAAAVAAVPIAARLGLGSVLGYLLAGLLIGPVLGLVGSEAEDVRHFAEFGVVMMLFLIGLELDPAALWAMRDKLLGLGGLQVAGTTGALTLLGITFGYAWQPALAVGMILALSSTAIVLQTLSEKRLMQTQGGRSSFAVLLTQDIAVIPMLLLLPLLATIAPTLTARPDGSIVRGNEDDHGHAMSLVEGLPGWGVTLVTLAAIAAIILLGVFATRPVFRYIHASRLREMYTALALLIVTGIAFLMSLVGLSPALGAFLAGVVLANSEFRHELEGDLEPFKGLLLGLFFITVGAGIDMRLLADHFAVILAVTIGVMAVKGAILYLLARAFDLRGRDRWLFTLGLAQAGEFGFVLISFAVQSRVLPGDLGQSLLLVVALSMLLTPLFFIAFERLSQRLEAAPRDLPPDEIDEHQPVIIAGIGRFGQIVNRLVQLSGFQTIVLDNDLETIELMRRFGFRGFFGDPTRPELLHAAGIDTARVLVVALDDRKAANKLVTYARRIRPDLHIVARARDRVHVYELYQAGANDITREMFDSSLRAGRYVLENIGLSEYEAAKTTQFFFHKDRENLRALASLWRPDIPVSENKAYVERARELNAELETALVEHMSEDQTAKARA